MASQVPAGWYDDPGGSGGERYWDGGVWTDAVRERLHGSAPGERSPSLEGSIAGGQGQSTGAPDAPRRTKRGPWLAAALVAVLLVVGAVLVVVSRSGVGGTTSGDRLADLPDSPEIAWSVSSTDLIDDLLDRLDQQAGSDPWLPTAQEVRDGGTAYLRDNGNLRAWPTGGSVAAVQPTLDGVTGSLHGIDAQNGELFWSTGRLAGPGRDNGWFFCEVATDTRAVCLSTADQDEDGVSEAATVRFVSLRDGTIVHEDQPTSEGVVLGLVAGPYGALLLTSTESRLRLARYDLDGGIVWEQQFDGDGRFTWAGVTADLVMLVQSGSDFPGAVLDLQTGEILREYLTPGTRDGLRTHYIDWGGVLVREEHRQSAGVTALARIDADGQERWRTMHDGAVLQPALTEQGGPLLVQDEDRRTVRALDPADGEEIWQAFLSGEWTRASLVSARDVVLTDDREIVVLDASTGERRWSQPYSVEEGRPSVYLGESLVYVLEEGYRLRAYELDDGELRWSWVGPDGPGDGRLVRVGGTVLLIRNEVLYGLR